MPKPLNQLPSTQNSERFLEYLAASSSLYARAKHLAAIQMILTVPFPIVLSIVAILNPERKVWSAFCCILVSILDALVIEKLEKNRKKEAAKIQELFDCELFDLDWNEFKVGDKPSREKIHASSEGFLRKESNVKKIKNWYSPHVERVPLHLARLICQRSNIYWDSELRRSYVDWITGLGLLISISTVIVGIALKMNLEIFVLSLLAPISPTLLWCIREANKQRESATTLDRLIKYSQQLWVDSLSDKVSTDEITERSRRLQDELFVHRYSNQPIFNWINNMLQQKYEAQMNLGAEELVACALKKDNR